MSTRRLRAGRCCAALVAGCLAWQTGCAGDAAIADTLLVNGRILRHDAAPAQSLAIRNGHIEAVGDNAQLRDRKGPHTRVIDLRGRTVIPGLIDSHIHAIRAGLTYGTEVDWIGARSITEAMARLTATARRRPPGSWLVVAGGWTEAQFAERRRPTQAELAAAAPRHHVYVQRLYTAALFSPGAFEALGVLGDPELASRLKVEADSAGNPSGWYAGDPRTVSDLYDRLPKPGYAAQLAGTRAFFRRLNSFGVTGVIDPGGYNMPVAAYSALFDLWRGKELTLRVVYSVCAPQRDREFEDLQTLTALLPMGAGDDWLRFNGIGENVVWGMYNNDSPSEASVARMTRVLRWAAARGLGATFHWNNERSVDHLLSVLENVAGSHDLRPLRWSIAHLNDASPASLARMRALGVGWLVQNALYFRGEELFHTHGATVHEWPRVGAAASLGVPVGMGTDAHRVMSYNPFVALRWLIDGRTVGGQTPPVHSYRSTRLAALRLYTEGSAWFAYDDKRRGALEPGRLADLAVLNGDYLEVPVSKLDGLRSVLTMVGGRVVYAEGGFAALEKTTPGPHSRRPGAVRSGRK